MEYQGNIIKMRSELSDPIQYFLPIGNQEIHLNNLLGKKIQFCFDGQINCISCGKKTKSSFSQGFCYTCFQTSPMASETIMRPELSKAHLGIARDVDWANEHDLIDHYVYLAVSSEIKVGVTRHHQIPTRWIDQGASYAIRVLKAPNRHIAGITEVFLKKYFTDKTNWRTMLQNKVNNQINLLHEKSRVIELLPPELRQYECDNNEVIKLNYPVVEFPEKVNSLTFDKDSFIEGKLLGIKGQYLLLDKNRVINLRKHNGYFLTVTTDF